MVTRSIHPASPAAPERYDVAILGAGPAGMSCADALTSFGLGACVIERSAHIGGAQRCNFHPNLWLLGAPGESGEAMTERLCRHYLELAIPTLRGAELSGVTRSGRGFRLDLATPAGPACLEAEAIVLATGARPRATAELARLAQGCRRLIVGPLAAAIRDEICASSVLILGGGDNAFDHALYLAERGNRATVCARGRFSARPGFRTACVERPEIDLRPHCRAEVRSADEAGVRVVFGDGGEASFDWLLVMYGYQPNSELVEVFAPDIRPRRLESGHVAVDAWQRTGITGIYAAGDLTDSPQPSVAVAMAQGLAAARAIERDRGCDGPRIQPEKLS